jgi:hypothetical protein
VPQPITRSGASADSTYILQARFCPVVDVQNTQIPPHATCIPSYLMMMMMILSLSSVYRGYSWLRSTRGKAFSHPCTIAIADIVSLFLHLYRGISSRRCRHVPERGQLVERELYSMERGRRVVIDSRIQVSLWVKSVSKIIMPRDGDRMYDRRYVTGWLILL